MQYAFEEYGIPRPVDILPPDIEQDDDERSDWLRALLYMLVCNTPLVREPASQTQIYEPLRVILTQKDLVRVHGFYLGMQQQWNDYYSSLKVPHDRYIGCYRVGRVEFGSAVLLHGLINVVSTKNKRGMNQYAAMALEGMFFGRLMPKKAFETMCEKLKQALKNDQDECAVDDVLRMARPAENILYYTNDARFKEDTLHRDMISYMNVLHDRHWREERMATTREEYEDEDYTTDEEEEEEEEAEKVTYNTVMLPTTYSSDDGEARRAPKRRVMDRPSILRPRKQAHK